MDKAKEVWHFIERKKVLHFIVLWALFFALALVFRLPHLLSRASFFDGDEAVIGIMASDLLAGRSFPIYFYGQSYGLSFLEVWSVTFWISLIGKGLWALRLAGILLFSLGTVFIFKGLINRGRTNLFAFLSVIAILSFPTWMLWGMLVRGGYVTSFVAVSLLFLLLSRNRISLGFALSIGFLLAVGYEAHSLLLLPVLPLMLREVWTKRIPWYDYLISLATFFGSIAMFHVLNKNTNVWAKPVLNSSINNMSDRWMDLKENLLNIYGDFYVYSYNFEIPLWWRILLIISLIVGLIALFSLFVKSKRREKLFWFFWLIAMASGLGLTFMSLGYNPRYYVGLFMGLLFLFIYYSDVLEKSTWLKSLAIISICIFLVGVGAGSKMKREVYDTNVHCVETFELWHAAVVKEKKKAVYLNDPLLQWQWNYVYGDEIPAAPFWKNERTNRFIDAFEKVSERNLNDVAMIGFWGHFEGLDSLPGYNDTRYDINKKYFVQPNFTAAYRDTVLKK